uniref:Uncharacterized protein n=1 Tax=Rhizophora mucronata TaxID=61149 RepID=A0A2P2QCQ6_RHIMU
MSIHRLCSRRQDLATDMVFICSAMEHAPIHTHHINRNCPKPWPQI